MTELKIGTRVMVKDSRLKTGFRKGTVTGTVPTFDGDSLYTVLFQNGGGGNLYTRIPNDN